MHENQTDSVKKISNVINFVYWKDTPIIVQHDEIKAIKEFLSTHLNIKLERSQINSNSKASVIDRPAYSIDGNVVTVKNKFIKVNLPSLGFIMVAEVEEKGGVMGSETGGLRKEVILQ
jgi:transcription antitermination factor NusG